MPDATPISGSSGSSRDSKTGFPGGGFSGNYGSLIGFGGVVFALLEIFRDDPKESIKLFAEFGPKYLLWGLIAFMAYDLMKRLIRAFTKSADKVADKMGAMADGMQAIAKSTDGMANKSDRTAEEMRRLCSFAASQSERAVDINSETHKVATRTYEMVSALMGKQGFSPQHQQQSDTPPGEGNQL